jgi:hypothetical protein
VPSSKETLRERLSRYRQIKLSVIGRNSGKTISVSVWFVLDGDKLYLLPVHGSDTQWYRNVLQNPAIRIDALGAKAELRATPITDAKAGFSPKTARIGRGLVPRQPFSRHFRHLSSFGVRSSRQDNP